MERSHEVAEVSVKEPEFDFKFSEEENRVINEALGKLSSKQFQAARLDASGMDASTIASIVKCHPQSITEWRRNTYYLEVKTLLVSIINRQGLQFRLDCQRQIIAPVYAELIRRVNTPRILKGLELKGLLDTVKIIGKETRLDSMNSGEAEEDDDLKDLQERRKNFSFAAQAAAIEKLKEQNKIIQFPTGTND